MKASWRRAKRRPRARPGARTLVLALALALSACGKKGAPSPPGPAEDITYPKIYPTK